MTAHEIAAQLSAEERSALVAVGTNRQGAVAHRYGASLLKTRCLIGNNNGLTRKGTIVRQIVVTQMEEGAFE